MHGISTSVENHLLPWAELGKPSPNIDLLHKGQAVQTGERSQTNGHTYTHTHTHERYQTTKRIISPAMRSIMMLMFRCTETQVWPVLLLLCCSLMLIPLWWYISHHNVYTNNVLYTGWTPIIGAMIISR